MKRIIIVLSAIVAGAFPAFAAEKAFTVALLGDSTVRTSYLPEAEQHHRVLEAALRKAAPKQKFTVVNWADNGESIPRYLIKGRYDRHRKSPVHPDLAILRFGINDQKYSTVEEFTLHASTLADLLIADFPGVTVILETGPYVDFPARYDYDRERVLSPYWQAVRELAEKRGFALIDFHAASQKANAEGNWDQRIRRTDRVKEPYVFDHRLDAERGHDVKWFADIHPNQEGVRLAVEAEVPVVLAWAKAPKASVPLVGLFAEPRLYPVLLSFPEERFKSSNPQTVSTDHLQTPVDNGK